MTETDGEPQASTTRKAAKKTAAKKSGAKKRTAKKSSAKKSAGKKGAAKPVGVRAARQREKLEEERAAYRMRIEANETRARSGQTAHGQPMTPAQIEMTNDILARQRAHLAELDLYEQTSRGDGDPRL